MRRILGVIAFLSLASPTSYGAGLQLGEPQYGGTGCPMGSAAIALSPDQQALSILFDQYVVEAGGSRAFNRKNCNIAIPVHVPQGYSVSVIAIDYRGFTGLPSGGRAQLSVNYFLTSSGNPNPGPGVRTSKTFYGPLSSDYIKSDSLGLEAIVWSGCGADAILRANTTLLVNSNHRRDQAMATVDSADVSSGIIYHLRWKSCH